MNMDEFIKRMFSNESTFDMGMDFHMDGCDCGDSCNCSPNDDCGCGGEHKEEKTMIYGIDIKIGPDGKPIVKEWGNVPSPFDGFQGLNAMNKIPEFGATKKMPQNTEIQEKTNIDFIDNPAEGKGKIIAEMPGVEKDDITITYREQKMHIQANGEKRQYKESVGLPRIDEKSIKALYKNGVLEVTFDYDHNIKTTNVKVE